MIRYEARIEHEDHGPVIVLAPTTNGELLSLTDVIEFIRSKEPSLLTDFYASIDPKRIQR